MENKEQYLSQEVLDTLCVRVAKNLPYLQSMDGATMWNKPMEYCQKVEKNVLAANTVILEALKEQGRFGGGSSTPYNYQIMLARVYILLYYRHADEELYKAGVFPELLKYMGIYGKELLSSIQDNIKKQLAFDKLMKQQHNENVKPQYRLMRISSGKADQYFSEFNNEKLFRRFSTHLEDIKETFCRNYDVTEIWLTAKDVVRKLWQEKYPENFIERIIDKLSKSLNTGYVELGAAQAVMLCAYAMMQTVTKSNHFQQAIKHIVYLASQKGSYDNFTQEIRYIGSVVFQEKESFDDYDYTGGPQTSADIFTKADVERMLQNQNSEVEQLKKQLAEQKAAVLARDRKIEDLEKRMESHTQEGKFTDEEIAEIKSELDEYRAKKKGLNPRQTAILGLKLAEHLHIVPSNKQELAKPLSRISGWGKRYLEQQICGYFNEEEESELADKFGDVLPTIAKIIYSKWESTQVP